MWRLFRHRWVHMQLERCQSHINLIAWQIERYPANQYQISYMLLETNMINNELMDLINEEKNLKRRWEIHQVIHELDQVNIKLYQRQQNCI